LFSDQIHSVMITVRHLLWLRHVFTRHGLRVWPCRSAYIGTHTIPDTPTKTHWSWAQFQKGQPTPCKTVLGPLLFLVYINEQH